MPGSDPVAASKLGSLVTSWTNLWEQRPPYMGVLCAAALLSSCVFFDTDLDDLASATGSSDAAGHTGTGHGGAGGTTIPTDASAGSGGSAIGGTGGTTGGSAGSAAGGAAGSNATDGSSTGGASGSGGSNADKGVEGELCDRYRRLERRRCVGSSGATGTGGLDSRRCFGRRRRRRNGWKRRRDRCGVRRADVAVFAVGIFREKRHDRFAGGRSHARASSQGAHSLDGRKDERGPQRGILLRHRRLRRLDKRRSRHVRA
jgi:hypothetical protein